MKPKKRQKLEVNKADLVLAWSVLENLAVSLAQIGGAYGHGIDSEGHWVDKETHLSMLKALDEYFSGNLIQQIAQARKQLSEYLSEEEAESLSEHTIPYWNYKGFQRRI